MSLTTVKDLFASDISRDIEEVIKVDQADEQIIREEIAEYVATDSIRSHFRRIVERYWETPNKPHEGIGVWVSGFFGSGKSSFAKYLGLALENRSIVGESAADLLAPRIGDAQVSVVLKSISEHVPTHAVIFDVSTDRGIRTGSQMITEIMYRLFLQSLGYARDLDLSELEIALEEQGKLEVFTRKYRELFDKNWDAEKGKIAFAVQQASRVMHELEPDNYPSVDSWRESAAGRADITPGLLADRCAELMERRKPGQSLVFVVDEVGQFVARDVQKMLDLQAVVQSLGRVGRGKMWLVVTSQEKLNELVGGIDDRRVELARLMDRFPQPLQVHLEPSDISEVTSKRVLSKNAEAQPVLRELLTQHRGRLTDNTRLTAAVKLPELSTDAFVDLYPLLPYQIDLIISVVSGLRTAGGASKHVGGANRTIIKLAQQLLIHPDVGLADAPVGKLARADQIYDLVASNIPSEIRGKIDSIREKVEHPLAQPVAKAICLLQYAQNIHRTAENVAAALHDRVDGDSRLAEVKAALEDLEQALMVRRGDDGYRIPSPAEDDWEQQRASLTPKPGDVSRLHSELVRGLWQPQPSYRLEGVKDFKAGLYLAGRQIVEGDVDVHLKLADPDELEEGVAEARRRSQTETKALFWTAALSDAIDRETVEVFRSREVLSRKERSAQTKDETALVTEEKRRQRRHEDELRRLLKQALLLGSVFFRGNDRSPDSSATDVGRATGEILSVALPEIFDRFQEAAARVAKADLETLMKSENLLGLTPVFAQLRLVRDEGGKVVINAGENPLAEVLARIEDRASYGEAATGRSLSDHFGGEPFGWEFDAVRLFVVALLRAGKIEATSKAQVIDSATSLDARNTFPNNNLFKGASIKPKVGDVEFEDIVEAAGHFKEAFGKDVAELEQGAVARDIKAEIDLHEQSVRDIHATLVQNRLPGADMLETALDHMGVIRRGSGGQVISTFNGAHKDLKEAIKRAAELSHTLTPGALDDVSRARRVLKTSWPFLETEPDLAESERADAEALEDLLARENFFRELPDIDQRATRLQAAYENRLQAAVKARSDAYDEALSSLRGTPGWDQLDADQQARVAEPLTERAKSPDGNVPPIPLLREQTENAEQALRRAVAEMFTMIDGNRLVRVEISGYFAGGIDNEEQLDAALAGLREQIAELIATGKKVIVQ
jgi:hypothetical protein